MSRPPNRASTGSKRPAETSNHDGSVEKKLKPSDDPLMNLTLDELRAGLRERDAKVQTLEALLQNVRSNAGSAPKSELGPGQGRRENLLVLRLAKKEQEIHDLNVRIEELSQALLPSTLQTSAALVDPLVNNLFSRLKAELQAYKEKAEEARAEYEAKTFTPDSTTGKRLLAKCKLLMEENAELGKQLSEGRLADIETELSLQRKYADELRQRNEELQEFVGQLDEELEHMQAAVLRMHHQNVELVRERNALRQEVETLRKGDGAGREQAPAPSNDASLPSTADSSMPGTAAAPNADQENGTN